MSKPEFSPENAIKTSGLERVLNIVPSAIIAVDKDQRICFFNQRAEDTFGYDAADVLDRPLQMLLPSGAHTRHGSLFETFAASTDVSREIPVTPDMRGKRKNGQEFPFSSTICRLEIDSEQFFSAVLHDVDSPRERGARLTERLMAFSRQQPVTQQRLDLSIVVRNFKELLARSLEQNITLQTDLATGLWLCETDISLIESALLNLVLNGRDAIASKAGSGKITITTRNLGLQQDHIIGTETVALGSYVVLTVSDTGIGMAKAVADKALEPFFTTKRIGRGSGLGLSTVHSTIKQAGGHLTVESESGIGTAITIYLPKAQLLQITDPGYSDTAKDENAVGKIVLLVEDDPGVRKTLAMMLKRLGHTVREAGSSAAALQQVESDPQIDILVSDIRLSNGMNGYQLGKECRRLIPNLLTLYIPGLVSDPIASADGLGAREQQLIKPFQTTQLAEMLARLLEQD